MDTPTNGSTDGPAVKPRPARNSSNEPLAIIGIGCRFPGGANDPDAFWKILAAGVDAITEVPADRWNTRSFYDPEPGKPGKTQSRWGGFIEGIDRFDPHFFGISPREAARMDPQQRLLLEVAWEALEDGGQPLERLSGSQTAVFVGISSWDYSLLGMNCRDRGLIDVHTNTGGSLSIAANRISYCFDFKGPSAAVDTACSSALLAVHLACQSIWVDRCPLALAGGVNALLLPDWYIGFSRLGMLSPDGRCRAFDAGANGFVRGEGAGMVLLKPLANALADGDRIYAVIRGTAVNQDGRTPGMTVPCQAAQAALLRQACHNAGVLPADIQFVEAHGTGTPVGDPIEARALGEVLSAGRPAGQPCLVGSVKTNIGHLESGAGIAGLIKTALALHHRCIPGNLHFAQPNPDIDFAGLRLRVPVRSEPWPQRQEPALAGVNSFGFGGTNAHVVLQETTSEENPNRSPLAPVLGGEGSGVRGRNSAQADPSPQPLSPEYRGEGLRISDLSYLVPLSARSTQALLATASRMRDFLASGPAEVSLHDIASSAALRRSHHEHRLAVVAHSKQELIEHLTAFVAGEPVPAASSARAVVGRQPRLAFVCSGQGPQWWGMGRQLLAGEPVFRAMIERCDAIVRGLGPWSLLDELTADETHSRMAQTAISQPAIFALQVALAALWGSRGVRPEAVVGHSVGEVAAAYLAGVFSLEDAVRVIYQRGRCMELASAHGRMLAASLALDEARRLVVPFGDRVSIAAINSPASVTFSGEPGPLEELAHLLEQRQVFCRFLQVHYAFHSAQMDPVRNQLLASLHGLQPRQATLPFFSTVTGQQVHGPELGPEYWWHNVRQTVRFADATGQLIEMGADTVLELSPHPVLTPAITECYQLRGQKSNVLPSLRRHEEERAALLRSLGDLHTRGYPVQWTGVFPEPRRFVRLPLYPWQRESCWMEPEESRVARLTAPAYPLLGNTLGGPVPSWETRLGPRLFPYLADHRVQRAAIVPASAWVSMAFAVAHEVFHGSACQMEDLKFSNPCFLAQDKGLRVQTIFDPDEALVRIHSRPLDPNQGWTPHFHTVLRARQPDAVPRTFCPEAIQQRCPRMFSGADCYAYFQKLGLDYGPLFQGIEQCWQGDKESLGVICLPDSASSGDDDSPFHPALLDACFQVVIPADKDFINVVNGLYLPVEIEQLRLYRRPGRRLWSHARLLEKTTRWFVADIDIYDEDGQQVARVRGLRSQRVAGGTTEETLDDLLYAYEWHLRSNAKNLNHRDTETQRKQKTEMELISSVSLCLCGSNSSDFSPGRWLIFADRGGVGEQLAERLRGTGAGCTLVFAGTAFSSSGDDRYHINPGSSEDMAHLLQTVRASGLPARVGIVHLWNLDAPSAEGLSTSELEAAQEAGLLSVLYLVQAWDKLGQSGDPTGPVPQLVLGTRGAQAVGEQPEPCAVAQAPVIGLGRVIVSEYPALRCKMVDLSPGPEDDSAGALFEELGATDEEDEIALRGSDRYVHRYVPFKGRAYGSQAEGPYQLTIPRPGTLDALTPRPLRRRPPGRGEVEIEVVAAGLNFSDVMKALGIYPGLADGPVPLGAECSGRITAVGEGVQGLHPGDEVLAAAPFAFSSHVTTRAELVAARPARLSFEGAATLPIAFLTAAYALDHLGHLGAGERVLIHSAAGGVGLAAVQLAQRAGADIFATAGTPAKRDFLRGLGIAHVMDSRTLAFAEEVLEQTGGQGVDVVLNSLAGEALVRSLAVLADYGRFLEIGKRDIYQNARLGLRPFRKNLSFFAIDMDRLMRERPALLGSLLRKLVQEVGAGLLAPLPHRIFSSADAVTAFRYMQQGKHIGKIVLQNPLAPVLGGEGSGMRGSLSPLAPVLGGEGPGVRGSSPLPGQPPHPQPLAPEYGGEGRNTTPRPGVPGRGARMADFSGDASYLITGGLGGFGLATARWMVERGARHLVLMGRHGAASPESQQAVAELEQLGARVAVKQADVSREDEVAAVLAEIDRVGPPLRGVLHAAMVLEDGLLLNMDRDLMRRVLAPKIHGAWNLHRQTANRPLDFFLLFSSLSSVFGHAGQANYAAANAFLDALAWYRRARGLPCLTINWGYLGDVGYLARRQHLGERLERHGVKSFTARQALILLERAIQEQVIQISVMRVDWSRWRGLGVTGRVSPRFAHLLKKVEAANGKDQLGLPALEAVLAAAPEERRGLLDTLIRDKVARVLGTSPAKLDGDKRLLQLGLDSLMAVELRNWIEGELQVSFPIVELMRSPSLSRLTELLLEQLTPQKTEAKSSQRELSEVETDALLTTLLADKARGQKIV